MSQASKCDLCGRYYDHNEIGMVGIEELSLGPSSTDKVEIKIILQATKRVFSVDYPIKPDIKVADLCDECRVKEMNEAPRIFRTTKEPEEAA